MRVLLYEVHLSTGGAPRFALTRAKSLLEYTDVEVYLVEQACHSYDYVVQRNAVKELLGDRFYSIDNNADKLFEIIENIKPDIIHIDDVSERINQDIAKKLFKNDRKWYIIETPHDVMFNPDNQKVFHPDLYLFCTQYHTDVYANMDSMFHVIEYPIDAINATVEDKILAKKELGFDFNKKNVINVGLWTKGKNQGEMLEIAKKYPDIQFHSIGNQAMNFADYWQPLMKDIPDNVKVWGERADVATFMKAADIFMFNSVNECNPLVLKEALSYNLPIISRLLPSYPPKYADYLNPIDTDLNTLKCNYNVPTDNSSFNFALRHEEAYKKILGLPIHQQKVKFIQHFVYQPFLEIKGVSDSDYRVVFYDGEGVVQYENTIKSNHWVKLNRQYFTNWTTKVFENGEMVYANYLHLNGKRVYIAFESKSLGDSISWISYVDEFRKKHQCKVICSTFWNSLFDYSDIEFVEPGTIVENIYALYRVGYFNNLNKLPLNPLVIPLQKVATAILGLDFTEMIPRLAYKPKVPKIGRYVTIATNSTSGCKFWTKEGWQALINWLVSEGYEVYNVSKELNPFDNCTQITTPSLESKMDWIAGSSFFIGLSSGLAWLAWAMGKQVVMISNFTEDWNEFSCIRITNKDVCHGCWNNQNFSFNPGDWNWCPVNKGTDKQFICHTSITADMIIAEIKKAGL